MDKKILTFIITLAFVISGLALVPAGYGLSSSGECKVTMGIHVTDNTIYPADPSNKEESKKANDSVKKYLDNHGGISGETSSGDPFTFVSSPNPQSGVEDPQSGTYYPSVYVKGETESGNTPSICARGSTVTLSFDIPAGMDFGIRIHSNGTFINPDWVKVKIDDVEFSRVNNPKGMYFNISNGNPNTSTSEMLWISSNESTHVEIEGHRASSFLQIQIFLKPSGT